MPSLKTTLKEGFFGAPPINCLAPQLMASTWPYASTQFVDAYRNSCKKLMVQVSPVPIKMEILWQTVTVCSGTFLFFPAIHNPMEW